MAKRLPTAPLLCVLAATFTASGALAQAPAAGAAPAAATRAELIAKLDESFARVDTDNNGSIGRSEIAAVERKAAEDAQAALQKKLAEQFARLDTDKSGQLSLAEFQAGATVRSASGPDAAMQRLDTNKDGKVTPDEYRARELGLFDRLDANKDGTVTAEEATKGAGR